MTKKDFELIAKVLATNKPPADEKNAYETWANIGYDMSQALAKTNAKFDFRRFAKACNNDD